MRVSIRTNRGDLLSSRRDSRTRGTFASLREEREAIGGEKKRKREKKKIETSRRHVKNVEGTRKEEGKGRTTGLRDSNRARGGVF